MRITNNMMTSNTTSNINSNKLKVNSLNTQMSTQQKISRPSEDPVIAMRSLRLSTTLSQINQYYGKNIPDAQSWMDVTETALDNMNKILKDVKTQCVKATNGNLNSEDRKTILANLKALQEQLYSEGNADYAGRTVFTGYRTNSSLTFQEDEKNTSYNITQNFKASDMESYDYYSGSVSVPKTAADISATTNIPDITKTTFNRMRLAYDSVDDISSLSYTYGGTTTNFTQDATDPTLYTATDPSSGNPVTLKVYDTEADWSAANTTDGSKTVGADDMVFIKSTGDLVMGNTISDTLKSNNASLSVAYDKTGFTSGELRPEYYYNCTDTTDAANPVTYTKYNADGTEVSQDINYTVAANQTMTVNLQASDVFDMSMYQDVTELINAVQSAIDAQDKVDSINSMIADDQYSSYSTQLQSWLKAAQKETDYANNNVTNLFSSGITKFDNYMSNVNLAVTDVGTRGERLDMINTRMSNQQSNVEQLKSTNDNRDISDIVIDYTAAYNAYQASLIAASKVEKQTLLDYL